MKLTLCTSCDLGRGGFATTLAAALIDAGSTAKVQEVDCLSGCPRPSALSVRDTGKVAYLFGDLTEADLPDLIRFTQLYAASPDGTFPDARLLGPLRTKAIARIPG